MAEIEELYVGLEYRWIIRDDFLGHLYNNNTYIYSNWAHNMQ